MAFGRQLKLLLWKNFTLLRRQPVRLVIELIWPLFLFLILVAVKKTRPDLDKKISECHYDGKAMPSAGPLPFFQGLVCTFSNKCHRTMTRDELPGAIDTWNSSIVSQFFLELETFLSDESEVGALVDLLEDLNFLNDLRKNPPQNCSFSLGSILIDPDMLRAAIERQNLSLPEITIEQLLNASLSFSQAVNFTQYTEWYSMLQNYNISRPQDAWNVSHQIRNMVCTSDPSEEILWLGSWNQTQALIAPLCNLTDLQFEELVGDVVSDLDWAKLSRQLVNCTGRSMSFLTEENLALEEIQKTANAFADLESIQEGLKRMNDTLQQALIDYRSDENGTMLNMSRLISQLFCGRDETLSPEETGRDMEEELEEELGDGEEEEKEPDLDQYVYDNDTTAFCNDLFKGLESETFTRLLWKQVKPMIRGKITYSPDTPAVRQIIKQANYTFDTLSRIQTVAQEWLEVSPNISDYLENNERIEMIRVYLDELARLNSTSELTKYIQDQVTATFGLPQDFPLPGIPDLPPIPGLPPNWISLLPNNAQDILPSAIIEMLGLNNLTGAGFEQLKSNLQLYQQWFSNDEEPGVYTWRSTINETNMLMKTMKNFLECFQFNKFEGHANEEVLVNQSVKYIEKEKLWAGLVFDMNASDPNTLPSFISYKIRMDRDRVDTTDKYRVLDRIYSPGPRDNPLPDMKYFTYGFAYIQDMVTHGIIRLQTNMTEDDEIGIMAQQFPYPCYLYAKFVMFISRSIPLFMVLAWIFAVAMIVKGIVYEKEQRLKEVMKMMGLSNGVHWLAWFITCFVMMGASAILLIMTIMGGDVIQKSSPIVMLLFFTAFITATIMQCFMFSVFFSKANIAAACAAIFYFIGYLPYGFCVNWEDVMTTWQKVLACLASTTAFGFGCGYIARYEETGEGLQWSNIAKSPVPGDGFNMAKVIAILYLDAAIYWLITWYVEAVKPGEFGMPRPWYFCFTRDYWCSTKYTHDDLAYATGVEMDTEQHKYLETEPRHLPLGVSVRGLRKTYKKGQKVAVDGLTLNFYEGQITSFLGHNGAGKTTTMSILTGLFPPTEGTAYIYNHDIRTDIDSIRKNMGMCPQHNVLFHKLTVEEHMWFYARLKGVETRKVKSEMAQMIKDVGLVNKRHDKAANLSGGMKRKLSVAIAFVGGSKLVILDEPTAGVDPYARRSIWELLLKYRKDRTIILSTHFMDEADILGDRIAIISQGKLCCCGSSLFLKDQFGSGYYLTMVKMNEEDAKKRGEEEMIKRPGTAASIHSASDIKFLTNGKDEGVADMSDTSSASTEGANNGSESVVSVPVITALIQKILPDARLVEDIGSELTYQLPDDKMHTASFDVLFNVLDDNLERLGVSSYGISDTTLEEVFLKVAEQSGVDNELNDETQRQQMELLTDGGNFARPVTRLSFRKNKKFSILGVKNKSTDERGLMDPDAVSNAGSVIEEELTDEEYADSGINIPIEVTSQCTGAGSTTLSGARLIARQFYAQLVKRFHFTKRSKKAFLVQIVLPAIFICLAMLFATVNPPSPDQPPMEIHPWLLIPKDQDDLNLYSFYSNDAPGSKWADQFEDLLRTKPGMGVRCMNPDIHAIKDHPCRRDEVLGAQWTEVTGKVNNTMECSCDLGYQVCPKGAGDPEPQRLPLAEMEYLYNMTGRNITDWILKSHENYIRQRYGGMSFGERNDLVRLNSSMVEAQVRRLLLAANGMEDHGLDVNIEEPQLLQDIDYVLENLATKRNAKIWFNNKGYVSMVAYMNVMNNLILRAHLPPSADHSNYGIAVTNHPMNRTRDQLAQYTFSANVRDVLIAISVIFAMSNVPASFIMFLCEERASNSKHLQFVSGINPVIYWLANFTWDMLNYLVTAVLCVLIMLAFQIRSYVSPDNAPALVALMLLYGWSVIPLMYPSSFLFHVPSTAFVTMSCVNIFLGIVSTLSTFILEGFMEEDLDRINMILMKVFLLLPHYCLGRGLIDMTRNQIISDTFAVLGENLFRNPFSWNIVGRNLLAMAALGPAFFIINLAIEYKFWYYKLPCFKPRRRPEMSDGVPDEDVDVARERRRVEGGATEDDVLTIEALTKTYRKAKKKGRRRAVDNISMGVHKGECFGLLGVNGAGKTTTFKMLTGDTAVSKGNAHLAGHSILTDMMRVHQNLGYCPQFDALCDNLTGMEHLQLYARLRGVPEKDVPVVAAWGIRKLGLTRYANKQAGFYSGGNKRKLSTAISLVGNPPVIFLDEPTTGMDPKARRFLWNCITNVLKDGRSVVLTSHSMEECEALCGRIAIMVNGTFKCLGSIQHLKNRFGGGYTLILRVSGQVPDLDPVISFIRGTFPACMLQERQNNMLQYQLGGQNLSLAYVFGKLEAVRDELKIEDYSVSQTTLDQVFINFAKQQTDMKDDELEQDRMAVPYPADDSPPLNASMNGTHTPGATLTQYHPVNTETKPENPKLPYVKPRPTETQYHGLENALYECEEESLQGSTVDLLPPRISSPSNTGITDVSNC